MKYFIYDLIGFLKWLAVPSTVCFLFFIFVSACGQSKASTTARAIEIDSPVGVVCYAIVEDGKAVGGSCLYQK